MPPVSASHRRAPRARDEKAAPLASLAAARFAVFSGPGGTGKTTLLTTLCGHPDIADGGVLLPAPRRHGAGADGVGGEEEWPGHQGPGVAGLLLESGWYDPESGRCRTLGQAGSAGADNHVASREVFKGRREEIAQLLDNISSGTHTAVFGLQRMGKTSLVEHVIKEHLPRRVDLKGKTYYVKIDFQQASYRRYSDLFDLFLRSIAKVFNSDRAQTLAHHAIEEFREVAQGAVGDRRQLFGPFADALKALIGVAAGKKVILFLDEFSEWCRVVETNQQAPHPGRPGDRPGHPHEELVDVDLMQFFSSVLKDADLRDRLVCVFAVRPFMAEYDGRKKLQILKLTQPIMLYYLDQAAANALITEPLRDIVGVDPEATDLLRSATAGHPYLIQVILKKVVDGCLRNGLPRVTRRLVEDECERMTAEGPAYEATFRVLDSDYSVEDVLSDSRASRGHGLLALLARNGRETEGNWVAHRDLRESMGGLGCAWEETDGLLDQLCHAKIIEERSVGDVLNFRMVIPLLRDRYLKQNFFLKHFRGRRS